ncbi:unnamed protein product [Closterium sp. NIES-64]|nr:unnamed protein product [Closterium sp. NIES-64]
MDTTSHAGNAGRNEQERKDQREWGNELKKAREALAEGRRREEELEGVVREGKKAMRELEEWIGRKVDAMSSLATVLREGWLREAVLSQAEGARKRARMMDGSPSHPVIMMEHLTALNGHAEAFRSMVQAVRMLSFGLENRNSHAGRMTEEKEGEATSEAAQNKAHADRMKEGKEEDGGDQWAMEIEEGEGEEAQEEGEEPGLKQEERGRDGAEEGHENEADGGEGRGIGSAEEGAKRGVEQGAGQGVAQGAGQGVAQGVAQGAGQGAGQWAGQEAEQGAAQWGEREPAQGAERRAGEGRLADVDSQSVRQAVVREAAMQEEVVDNLSMVQPLITAARTAGSRGGASVDSGGAVTNVEDRPAHKGGGNRTAGRAGGPPSSLFLASPLPATSFLTPHCYPGLLPSVTTLNLQKLHPVSPCAVNLLLRMPSLTALHLHETSVRSDALPLFPRMSRLQRLVIACADPSIVLNLPASRQGNLPAQSDPISTIQPFQSLRELHVSRVTDSTLQFVGMLCEP